MDQAAIYPLKEIRRSIEMLPIQQYLKALEEVVIEEHGKSVALRTKCVGVCGKIFQAAGGAIPPAIREP